MFFKYFIFVFCLCKFPNENKVLDTCESSLVPRALKITGIRVDLRNTCSQLINLSRIVLLNRLPPIVDVLNTTIDKRMQ